MQGDEKIIETLNAVLTSELTAINQYYIHSKMCEDWGYLKLAKKKKEESIEEMHHADIIIGRILLLSGVPNMQRLNPVRVGENVPEQHKLDLELEYDARDRLNQGIALCRDKNDNVTRELFEQILKAEEEGIDWLEAQLQIIKDIGKERYLAEML